VAKVSDIGRSAAGLGCNGGLKLITFSSLPKGYFRVKVHTSDRFLTQSNQFGCFLATREMHYDNSNPGRVEVTRSPHP
jgi:hypothetical protein